MTFDTAVPEKLKRTQQWFASIITRPIDDNSQMNPVSPSGIPMEKEAWTFIAPSHTMQPEKRIELYNQQYWWRLLSTLQEDYPCVVRLFGFHDFNVMIAIPYLEAYPPNHWNLNNLGKRLPEWVQEAYQADDKEFVLNAAKVDRAYSASFVAPKLPPIDMNNLPVKGEITSILDRTIYLQPYIHLFSLDRDLLNFRFELLKQDPDYWVEHDFPKMEKGKEFFYVLFRNSRNMIAWHDADPLEFGLLSKFKEGATIESALEWLEKENISTGEVMEKLPVWFKRWAAHQWLTLG